MANSFELRRGNSDLEAKVLKVELGQIPDNPSDISERDIKALKEYYKQHPDQFPSETCIDVREWENWRNISIKYNEDNNKWTVSYRGFFKGEEVIQEFDSEEKGQQELDKLKNYNKQIALDLIRESRNFAMGVDLDIPWSDPVDVSSGTFMGSESAITPPVEKEKSLDTSPEDMGEALPGSDALKDALDGLVEELATKESSLVDENSNTLQQELDRLIGETDQRLSRESEPNKEKLERFKDNARQAISNFQQFARDHSSPADKANSNVQEQYRQYENTAWDELYKLAHLLDGEIVTLPQDRDIQLSHPEGVDTKEYLKQIGYKFDEKGDIVEIMNKGVNIRLNRARTIQNLINSKRPSHLLYNKSFTLEDNDIYQGYIIEGLNLNTPDWMEIVLNNKQFLEPVIVDEISQSDNSSEYTQDPWERKSKGETEFDKIFTDSNKVTGVTQVSNKIPDPWVKQSELLENTAQSTEKSDTLELYRQQGFNEAQLAFIKQVIDAGDTADQIALYAKPEYEVAQMMVEREKKLNPHLDISQYEGLPYWQQTWIITGIRAGHTPEQIALYAKPGISSEDIQGIKSDIQSGLTIEQINEKKIKKRAEGYLNIERGFSRNNLIRQLESEGFTNEQATQAIDSMDIDWNQQAIKRSRSYLQSSDTEFSQNSLIKQLEYEGFTNEQAQYAVDNILDYDWKEEKETNPENTEQTEGGETTSQVSLDDLRLAYARAEESWNRKQGDEDLEDAFKVAREAYNTELEKVLKLQVAEGQEANIHQIFKYEVMSLRDSRIEQSQELQGKWEKRFNNSKEKFLGWATKNKRNWMITNAILFAGATGLSLLGAGAPVAGSIHLLRRSLGSVMSGVGARNTLVGLMEDRDIRINKGFIKINFQAVVPKIVRESISESEEQIKQVSGEVLKDRLGTLDAYYRLNGGKFNDNQQKAYEKVLTELARRVQENVIDVENPPISIQPLTTEQLERNRNLYGWGASYELAKIAKSQNIDLSLLSREDYADFAIQNKLMIDDTQLRMSPWQRMCESVDEVRKGDKERQSLINPEADEVFDKFSSEIRQKAGESDRNIDNNIIVRQGTNNSEDWLYFGINQGADSSEDQIFKSYISLQDLNTLTPDKFTDFMKALRDSGYNGDIKVFQDLLSQGIRLNDQIVMHGASEANAKLGLDVAYQFFGDSLAHKSSGIDMKINGKSYSYSQLLAQNIKNSIQDSSSVEEQNYSTEVAQSDRQELATDRYTSELLNTISDTRIAELDKFRRKRKIATGIGLFVTGIGAGALLNDLVKPGSMFRPDIEGSGKPPTTGGDTPEVKAPGTEPTASGTPGSPEAGAGVTKTIPDASPAGTGAEATEALRQQAADAANEAREVLAQDVSNLDSGETIWSQASKWLGPDASQGQIQEAVENYLQSQSGQESIFKLAQQTEGGRELLAQFRIDDAGEMAKLELKDLYKLAENLGEGKLDGLTELSLDNLDALKQAEYVAPSPTEAPTIETGSTETPAPPAGTEDIGSKPPAPSSPPVTEAPVATPSPVEAPVTPSEFTKDLSEILGKQNLTDIQAKEIVQSYFADDYGREAIYNSIINTGEGATVLSNGFGVNTLADFANITPDQMYEITNSIDSNELRKILNQTILARFEDAPDMVELTRGTNSLNVVQRYIANELGSLPYDSNLGKQVLDTYVQTDAGKMWIYDAIVNNPDVNNQNIQYFKEYLRFKDIKSPEEFVSKFNWVEFSGNRNIPTSGFWNQIRLPNGGTRLQPLSSFLNPGPMPGIKDAVRQVLTRQ